MIVCVQCTARDRTDSLFATARRYESIEYVSIYPHRIVYGHRVRVLRDNRIVAYDPSADKSALVEIESLDRLRPLFDALESDRYECIFVRFSDRLAFSDILNVVENISNSLLSTVRRAQDE